MRALVVTHGNWGRELVEGARDVYATETPIDFLSNAQYGVNELSAEVAAWLGSDDGPAVVMVDVSTGSCGTAALMAAGDRADTWVLGGVNMPMILTYLTGEASLDPLSLVTKMLDRTLNSVHMLTDPS